VVGAVVLGGFGVALGAAVAHRIQGNCALTMADDERDHVVAVYPSRVDGRNYGGERYGDEAGGGASAHDR
jgi:hypothetical protein